MYQASRALTTSARRAIRLPADRHRHTPRASALGSALAAVLEVSSRPGKEGLLFGGWGMQEPSHKSRTTRTGHDRHLSPVPVDQHPVALDDAKREGAVGRTTGNIRAVRHREIVAARVGASVL